MSGNLSAMTCIKCGDEVEFNGFGYRCRGCGKEYQPNIVEGLLSDIQNMLNAQKQEQVANFRRQLWQEVTRDYISNREVERLCNGIMAHLPEDFYANFYLSTCSRHKTAVTEFLSGMDVEEHIDDVSDILDYLIKALRVEWILPVGNLIELAYKSYDVSMYNKYRTRFEKECANLDEGLFEPGLARDVFICYSSKDMPVVEELCDKLEEEGVVCFVAARNLRHGSGAVENYENAIRTAIDNCSLIVFVSSSNSRSIRCDALKELRYIDECDRRNACKKPRVEFLIENYRGNSTEPTIKRFFSGLEYTTSVGDTAVRVAELMLGGSQTTESVTVKEPVNARPSRANNTRNNSNTINYDDGSVYVGEVLDGEPHGFGKMTYSDDDEYDRDYYEGNWKNGEFHGRGKIVWVTGEVFEGELENGERNGYGKVTYDSGDTYEGNFVADSREGYGKYIFKDGERYEGEFHKDNYHGHGKLFYTSGATYVGEFKDDKKCGYGKYTYADGSTYEGMFKDDKYEGHGKYVWSTGEVYEGEYKNDVRDGYGKMTYTNGEVEEGTWKNDKFVKVSTNRGSSRNTSNYKTINYNNGAVYFGEVLNGEPHGYGTKTWAKNEKGKSDKYEGEWVKGRMHGYGTYTWASGSKYEGDWKDGNQHGKGKRTWADGDVYEGDYVNDKKHGHGKFIWKSGDTYEGEYTDDARTGYGKYVWASGNRYEGNFVDGKCHGKGKTTWKNGDTYEGDYVNDSKTGHGVYTWTDGTYYEGEFVDGNFCGYGVKHYKNGTVEEGTWKDDKLVKAGAKPSTRANTVKGKNTDTITYTDGSVYVGEVKNGKAHGYGKLTYASGDKWNRKYYEGNFVNGNRHGKGKLVWTMGDVYDGDWTDGKMQGRARYEWADGRVYTGSWYDGKRSGKGKLVYAKNDKYKRSYYDGDWKDGNRHGKGKLAWTTGEVYDGQWISDSRNGCYGRYIYASNDAWNRSYYEGEWDGDNRHGNGKLVWKNGDSFDGIWANDKRAGKGVLRYANGKVERGIWDGDKLVRKTFF